MKNYILVFFIIFISNKVHSCKNDFTVLKINSKQLSNQTIKINSIYFSDSITLDSKGLGEIQFNIKKETFVFLSLFKGDLNFSKILLLKNGYNLTLILNEKNFSYKGFGKDQNWILNNCENFTKNKISDLNSFVENTNSIDSIIEKYQNTINTFKKYFKEITKNKKLVSSEFNILQNNFLASFLSEEQNFIRTYYTKLESDSLSLEDKFYITKSDFFKDSILLNSGSPYIMNFLTWNFDFRLQKEISFNELGKTKYCLAVDSVIENDSFYGNSVKEYLFYNNLNSSIFNNGLTKEVEQLLIKFQTKYPNSIYIETLKNLSAKFDKLGKGNDAPNTNLTSINGKSVMLSDLKGKVLFIDVWATWCLPCIKKMPTINKFENEFDSIVFVYLSIDSDENTWKRYIEIHQNMKNQINLISLNSDFESLYRISSVPRYILIDKNGKLIDAFLSIKEEEIHDILFRISNHN